MDLWKNCWLHWPSWHSWATISLRNARNNSGTLYGAWSGSLLFHIGRRVERGRENKVYEAHSTAARAIKSLQGVVSYLEGGEDQNGDVASVVQ